MELFGKEVLTTKKQKKTSIIVGFILGIIILIYMFIVSPTVIVLKKQTELRRVKANKVKVEKELIEIGAEYAIVEKERREQEEKLNELIEEFRKNSYKDEAMLKQMVQDMLDYLDLELLEIGKTEIKTLVGEIEYKKKSIPYKIRGDGRAVALLFYYLENSKSLVVLKSNRLEITVVNSEGTSKFDGEKEAKFKLGYYYIATGQGENNEKKN